MIKIFSNKLFSRVTCLVLAAIFLSSFSGSATDLALCLDEEENHVVDQEYLHLADCHSSVEAERPLFYEHCFTLAGEESKDCVDISLTNANAANLPSKIILPVSAKDIFSCMLPDSQIGSQQQVVGYTSSVLSRLLFPSSFLNAHRTVVLLI